MLILFLFLFLIIGTAAPFIFFIIRGDIPWAILAMAGQGLVLILFFLWSRRHPELGDKRAFDIATTVGIVSLGTLMAIGLSGLELDWVDPGWMLILAGTPVCALLMSFPLSDIVAFVPSVLYTVHPPQAVADGMMSESIARYGKPAETEAESEAVASATEARWTRRDLETGSRILAKLRQYLLASGLLASLFVLVGELSETRDATMAVAVARSVMPFACGLGLAQFVCLPLQTKLEYYARYLNGTSESTSSP